MKPNRSITLISCLIAMFVSSSASLQATMIYFGASSTNWETEFDTAVVDVDIVSNLFPWGTGYNDLANAAYGNSGGTAIIDFIPASGSEVTLESFDLGNWLNNGATTQYHIYDLSNLSTPILSVTNLTVTYDTTSHPTYSVNLSSSNGLRLELGPDLFNVGVQNIVFSSSASSVPDSGSTAALLGLTFLGIIAKARHKSR